MQLHSENLQSTVQNLKLSINKHLWGGGRFSIILILIWLTLGHRAVLQCVVIHTHCTYLCRGSLIILSKLNGINFSNQKLLLILSFTYKTNLKQIYHTYIHFLLCVYVYIHIYIYIYTHTHTHSDIYNFLFIKTMNFKLNKNCYLCINWCKLGR